MGEGWVGKGWEGGRGLGKGWEGGRGLGGRADKGLRMAKASMIGDRGALITGQDLRTMMTAAPAGHDCQELAAEGHDCEEEL
jgi:hypothetical protein